MVDHVNIDMWSNTYLTYYVYIDYAERPFENHRIKWSYKSSKLHAYQILKKSNFKIQEWRLFTLSLDPQSSTMNLRR